MRMRRTLALSTAHLVIIDLGPISRARRNILTRATLIAYLGDDDCIQ